METLGDISEIIVVILRQGLLNLLLLEMFMETMLLVHQEEEIKVREDGVIAVVLVL